jgi:hypothetical protein
VKNLVELGDQGRMRRNPVGGARREDLKAKENLRHQNGLGWIQYYLVSSWDLGERYPMNRDGK